MNDQFFNRELSWLAFNDRVFAEAANSSNPLLERLRFATIVASNLDEFFMVRVAGLKNAIHEGDTRPDDSGMTPSQQLEAVSERANTMLRDLHTLVWDSLVPSLAEEGILIRRLADLSAAEHAAVSAYFKSDVLAALTPLAIDMERPFPMLSSLSLNLAFWLRPADGGDQHRLAVVQVPAGLSRLVRVSGTPSPTFVLLDKVICAENASLFPGQSVVESVAFRLSRDAELELDDEGGSFLEAVEQSLRQRRRGDVIRLELEAGVSAGAALHLTTLVQAEPQDIYRLAGALDVRGLAPLADLAGYDALRFPPRPPVATVSPDEQADIFTTLDAKDILLHHPYESFDPVVAFVEAAAEDPDVLAIKQTLYRTGNDSPLVSYLVDAARAGKDVTVVVELRARFDEEANIQLANRLQEAGVQVVYGVVGYKTHAKVLLIVRREQGKLRRYVHLSTGNYHQITSRIYTDFGLMTAHRDIGEDAHKLFQQLSGLGPEIKLKRLLQSPFTLHRGLMEKIEREISFAGVGKPARIIAKMNALNETGVIELLYKASMAGVQIDLIVRGACTLRPGVPGISDNIRVRSIVGRFLEHSRVYWFANAGEPEIFCSSADWMERNLLRRIETCFPILDPELAQRVYDEALDNYLADNAQAWALQPDGNYVKLGPGNGAPHSAQQALLNKLCG